MERRLQLAKGSKQKQIGPELWIYIEFMPEDFKCTFSQRDALQNIIQKYAEVVFYQRFGFSVELVVVIKNGSIWIKIKPKLNTLALIVTLYMGANVVPGYLSNNMRWIETNIRPIVKKVVNDTLTELEPSISPKVKIIEVNYRKGIIERIDDTIEKYEKGKMSEQMCISQIRRILKGLSVLDKRHVLRRKVEYYAKSKLHEVSLWRHLDLMPPRKKEEEEELLKRLKKRKKKKRKARGTTKKKRKMNHVKHSSLLEELDAARRIDEKGRREDDDLHRLKH